MRILFLSYLGMASAYAADCPGVDASLDVVEAGVLEGRVADPKAALAEAEQGFACGEVATSERLARFWVLEGTLLTLGGDPGAAADSFWAAKRVSPDYWNTDLGPKLADAYAASTAPAGDTGAIEIQPAPVRYTTYLDGEATSSPIQATPGLHLVQIGPEDGPIAFARFVYIAQGQSLLVETALVETEPVGEAPVAVGAPPTVEPIPSHKRRNATGLVLAGVAAIGSAAAFGLTASEHPKYAGASSLDELDRLKRRQIGWSVAGLGLAGASTTSLVLHFAL